MNEQLPLDTSCQAEYEDGYVYDETEHDDVSAFVEGANVFSDILNRRLEAEHGRMVRFSVFYKNHRYDIDWTQLPDNARPIRFRDGFNALTATGEAISGWSGCRMGFQFNDESGKNVQDVREL